METRGVTERAKAHYDRVADSYATPTQDGSFHFVRRREITAIVEYLLPGPGRQILDAGCGPGYTAQLLRDRGATVVGVDVSPRMLEIARPHLDEAHLTSIEALELGRQFDSVLCAGALEFTESAQGALRVLARHVRPGGRLVLLFPTAGIGGVVYRWVQKTRGMQANLQSIKQVERWLLAEGLTPTARTRPFLHCCVAAFTKRG